MTSRQISYSIPADFIWSHASLTLAEMACGFREGWVDRDAVISWAVLQSRQGVNDPKIEELAGLLADEKSRVDSILARVKVECTSPENQAKWLYLVLAWLYENRAAIPSVLDVIEMIYSDFDYPSVMEPFVPYMPPPPNSEPSESGLISRWRSYLEDCRRKYLKNADE